MRTLDLSSKKKIVDSLHWSGTIDQLYHPTGIFQQDSFDAVYSARDISTTKFIPILLKEWFFLLRKGGYLVIDYQPSGICNWKKLEETMWWLWKDEYEIIYHGTINQREVTNLSNSKLKELINYYESYYSKKINGNSLLPEPLKVQRNPESKNSFLRFVCKKIETTKLPKDDIGKWSFGIITNGKRLEIIDQIIQSIRRQNIPQYEILICGSYFDRKEKDVKYLPFNQRDELGWITKKKNIIVNKAKYENLCILHDRVIFTDDWYKGMKKWGNCFEHLACRQDYCQERANDWELHEKIPGERYSFASLLDYRDWDFDVFQSGQLHIMKRSYIKGILWNESFFWGEPEDLVVSNDLRDNGYLLRCNVYSEVKLTSYKFGDLPLVGFNRLKLSKKRSGNLLRIYQRKIYKQGVKYSFLKENMLRIWKKLYRISLLLLIPI